MRWLSGCRFLENLSTMTNEERAKRVEDGVVKGLGEDAKKWVPARPYLPMHTRTPIPSVQCTPPPHTSRSYGSSRDCPAHVRVLFRGEGGGGREGGGRGGGQSRMSAS